MVRKRLDDRVRTLIERGVVNNERSLLILVGDYGKDQVPNLHQILSKTSLQTRPNVLWCYKKELGFSTHRQKRIKKLKRDKARGLTSSGAAAADSADNFELFISSTDINWCYYKDSHRVLGTTVGMLVLQDFEALTPNLMARTIETVKGGVGEVEGHPRWQCRIAKNCFNLGSCVNSPQTGFSPRLDFPKCLAG